MGSQLTSRTPTETFRLSYNDAPVVSLRTQVSVYRYGRAMLHSSASGTVNEGRFSVTASPTAILS